MTFLSVPIQFDATWSRRRVGLVLFLIGAAIEFAGMIFVVSMLMGQGPS